MINLRGLHCFFIAAVIFVVMDEYAIAKELDPVERQCGSVDDSLVDSEIKSLDVVENKVPNITPEELHYLRAEFDRIVVLHDDEGIGPNVDHSKSSTFYAALSARPLFPAWQFRKDIDKAKSALNLVLKQKAFDESSGEYHFVTYPKYPEAEKLKRAIDASVALTNYVRAAESFLNDMQRRSTPYLSPQEVGEISFGAGLTSSSWSIYMTCKLATIMGPSGFSQ